jgi:hypothetical protein
MGKFKLIYIPIHLYLRRLRYESVQIIRTRMCSMTREAEPCQAGLNTTDAERVVASLWSPAQPVGLFSSPSFYLPALPPPVPLVVSGVSCRRSRIHRQAAATRLLSSSCVCHGSRSTPPPPQAPRWSRPSRLARRRHHRPPLSPSLVSPFSPARSNLPIWARSHFEICAVLGTFGLSLNCFRAISIEMVKRSC